MAEQSARLEQDIATVAAGTVLLLVESGGLELHHDNLLLAKVIMDFSMDVLWSRTVGMLHGSRPNGWEI